MIALFGACLLLAVVIELLFSSASQLAAAGHSAGILLLVLLVIAAVTVLGMLLLPWLVVRFGRDGPGERWRPYLMHIRQRPRRARGGSPRPRRPQ